MISVGPPAVTSYELIVRQLDRILYAETREALDARDIGRAARWIVDYAAWRAKGNPEPEPGSHDKWVALIRELYFWSGYDYAAGLMGEDDGGLRP